MTAVDELRAQLEMVVELAVLRRPHGAVLVRERLVARGDVDDAETARADRDSRAGVDPAVVGPAVRHRVGHRLDVEVRSELAQRTGDLDDAADSTHGRRSER